MFFAGCTPEVFNQKFLERFAPAVCELPTGDERKDSMSELVEDLRTASHLVGQCVTNENGKRIRFVPAWTEDRKKRYMDIVRFMIEISEGYSLVLDEERMMLYCETVQV